MHTCSATADKINNIVPTAGSGNGSGTHVSHIPAPIWDNLVVKSPTIDSSNECRQSQKPNRSIRDDIARGSVRDSSEAPSSDLDGSSRQSRSDIEALGVAVFGGYSEMTPSNPQRRHEYDVQTMEPAPRSPTGAVRNSIPSPIVTVRSEFPTINRSRQQQTFTCLVTVEVAGNKWKPDPEDTGNQAHQAPSANTGAGEVAARSVTPAPNVARVYPKEPAEALEEMTESLQNRVDNWYGLDFSRFGQLRLHGTLRISKDKVSWRKLECYLFAEMLICVKTKKPAPWDDNGGQRTSTRCTLKGSILIKKHLNDVSETGAIDEKVLTLRLSVAELPQFYLWFQNRDQLKLWNKALLDMTTVEEVPLRRSDYDPDIGQPKPSRELLRSRRT